MKKTKERINYAGTIKMPPAEESNYVRVIDEQTIDHPKHYTKGSREVINIIDLVLEHTGDSFTIGNAIKYICRYKEKGSAILDLEKAIWYLKREIKKLEEHTTTTTGVQGDAKRG